MATKRSKFMSAVTTATLLAGGMVVGAAAPSSAEPSQQPMAAAPAAQAVACGTTIKRLPNGGGPFPNKKWDIYYRNCGSTTVTKRVDIARGRDTVCSNIARGTTKKWHYETGYFGPDYPRSVVSC